MPIESYQVTGFIKEGKQADVYLKHSPAAQLVQDMRSAFQRIIRRPVPGRTPFVRAPHDGGGAGARFSRHGL